RYTPPGGIVAVSIQIGETEICIQVSDTGEGIDPIDLPRIWERFYQGRNADGERHSGLGLAIVHELSASMHGHVAVSSTLGEGSRFSVWLPRAA
ncbi:MAG TPA: sensor histidine kinase, partial [Anaerolineaceae bacterium]|nr:sensor histidine kinase [Anaerolineaceae bacterium]